MALANTVIFVPTVFYTQVLIKCLLGIRHQSRGECNGVKGTLTFVHQSTWCPGSQGPLGLGYSPPNAAVWWLRAVEAIARGLLQMAVARDMMSYASYRISGRWCIWCYVTIYIMYWWYKSGCNPVLGSPFASAVARDLSTPFSQLSHRNSLSPGSLLGIPEVSYNKLLGFELSLCDCVLTSRLNRQAALLRNPSRKC